MKNKILMLALAVTCSFAACNSKSGTSANNSDSSQDAIKKMGKDTTPTSTGESTSGSATNTDGTGKNTSGMKTGSATSGGAAVSGAGATTNPGANGGDTRTPKQ